MALRQKQHIPQDNDFLVQGYFPDTNVEEGMPSYGINNQPSEGYYGNGQIAPQQMGQAVYQSFDPYAGPQNPPQEYPPQDYNPYPPQQQAFYPAMPPQQQGYAPNGVPQQQYTQQMPQQGYNEYPPNNMPQQGYNEYPPSNMPQQGYMPNGQYAYPPNNNMQPPYQPQQVPTPSAGFPDEAQHNTGTGFDLKALLTNPSRKTLTIGAAAVVAVILLIVIITSLTGYDAQKDMREAIAYFRKVATVELISIADQKDATKMIQKLQEAIPKFDEYSEKYSRLMADNALTPQEKIAATLLKTAFYDVSANCLKPMLSVMQGSGGTFPEFANIVNNSLANQIIPAENSLNEQ